MLLALPFSRLPLHWQVDNPTSLENIETKVRSTFQIIRLFIFNAILSSGLMKS